MTDALPDIHFWVETAVAAVTACATIALVCMTWVLARETKRLAAIGQQPQVILTIEPTDFALHLFNFHIQNAGTAAAYAIDIQFSPALELSLANGKPFSPLNKISILKPGQNISSYLGDINQLTTTKFTVTTRWKRRPLDDNMEALSYEIDLANFARMYRLGHPPAEEISKHLKDIAKALEGAISGYKRLQVDVFGTKDRGAEQKSREETLKAVKGGHLSEFEQ